MKSTSIPLNNIMIPGVASEAPTVPRRTIASQMPMVKSPKCAAYPNQPYIPIRMIHRPSVTLVIRPVSGSNIWFLPQLPQPKTGFSFARAISFSSLSRRNCSDDALSWLTLWAAARIVDVGITPEVRRAG